MELSYNWLNQYVSLKDISALQLRDLLTNAGLEVEGVYPLAQGTHLVVGHVLECKDHPDSDHLHVCQVQINEDTVSQIVCGASNVAANQKVIVAMPGAQLPAITIKKSVIRGVESNGMICSLSELGVDKKRLSEHQLSGIEILPDTAIVGADPLKLLGLDDVILDVSLTPNRSDCLSLWAMAKEVAAIIDRPCQLPISSAIKKQTLKTQLTIQSSTERCCKFLGQIVNKVTVKESPVWLKQALMSVGIKSINNIVDISNYVMMETGQPLHFYDCHKLPSKEITVSDQVKGQYQALDGQTYDIEPGDLMIQSAGNNIGIAGIMGGDDSKIDENTTAILIEAAIFDRVSIRKTSRRLNLATEASIHFQKGIDPLAPEKAIARSIELLTTLADATDIESLVVFDQLNYQPTTIEVTLQKINRHLGTNIDQSTVVNIFKRLDLNPEVNDGIITVTVPSYRTDLVEAVDLIEEVIRIVGYDQITSTLPVMPTTIGCYSYEGKHSNQVKQLCASLGFNEIISYSLVSTTHIQRSIMPLQQPVQLANPMSEDRAYYRMSLLPSMMDVIAYNQARSLEHWSLFEVGNVYDNQGTQQERLALSLSKQHVLNQWQNLTVPGDFFAMKGKILTLLQRLGFDEKRVHVVVCQQNYELLHPNQSADIYLDKTLIGCFGMLHPKMKTVYDVDDCVVAEINLSAIYQSRPAKVKYQATSKYPSISYDVSFIVNDAILAGDIMDKVKKTGGKLVQHVSVFDVYKGKGIDDDKKSLAIKIVYQSFDKTLTENDVLPIHQTIIEVIQKDFNAIYRDK